MSRGYLLAPSVALLAAFTPPGPAGAADAVGAATPAVCVLRHVVSGSPGLSMTSAPSEVHTDAQTGAISCHGTLSGKQITGTGSYAFAGRMGTGPLGNPSCAQGVGAGTHTFTIPTTDGVTTISEPISITWVGAAGVFRGGSLSGAFEFTPLKGDCLTRPITQATIYGEGFLLR